MKVQELSIGTSRGIPALHALERPNGDVSKWIQTPAQDPPAATQDPRIGVKSGKKNTGPLKNPRAPVVPSKRVRSSHTEPEEVRLEPCDSWNCELQPIRSLPQTDPWHVRAGMAVDFSVVKWATLSCSQAPWVFLPSKTFQKHRTGHHMPSYSSRSVPSRRTTDQN